MILYFLLNYKLNLNLIHNTNHRHIKLVYKLKIYIYYSSNFLKPM